MSHSHQGRPDIDERIATDLEAALAEEDPTEKNYHIRSALQGLVLLEEGDRQ